MDCGPKNLVQAQRNYSSSWFPIYDDTLKVGFSFWNETSGAAVCSEKKRGETEAQPYYAVDVPKKNERLAREERKDQSGSNGINRGVKEHRQ